MIPTASPMTRAPKSGSRGSSPGRQARPGMRIFAERRSLPGALGVPWRPRQPGGDPATSLPVHARRCTNPSAAILPCLLGALLLAASAVAADPLRIEATDGGVVALSGLTTISTQGADAVEVRADGAGSRVELPALARFQAFSGDGQSRLEASDGGHLVLRADRTRLGRNVALHLGDGGSAEAGRLELGLGARLSGRGLLAADLINAGSVDPGDPDGPTGSLSLSGDYAQDPQGELAVALTGAQAGAFDRLQVQGAAALDGRLAVATADGWMPEAGTRLRILDATTRVGEFATAAGLQLGELARLGLVYADDGAELAADGPGFCADWDTDCDGMDDDWERSHFGDLDRDGSDDLDGDGISDLDEYRDGTDPTRPEGVELALTELIVAPDRGLEFDGLDDFVEMPNTDGRYDLGAWTIEATVEPLAEDPGGVVGDGPIVWKPAVAGGNATNFALAWTDSRFVALVEDAGTGTRHRTDSDVLAAGQPYRVAASFDGSVLSLYLDGALASELVLPEPIGPPTGPAALRIGNSQHSRVAGDGAFAGIVSEVRLWDHARDPAVIARDLSRRLHGSEIGLVGYWAFEEPEGLVALDRAADPNDGLLGGGDADLAPQRLLQPPIGSVVAEPGDAFEVFWSVTNLGTAVATAAYVDTLRLDGAGLPAGDLLLASVPAGDVLPLAPDGTYAKSVRVTLPSDLEAGLYEVSAEADAAGRYRESNEANNRLAAALAIEAPPPVDLAVTGISGPLAGEPGETIQVEWTLSNLGDGLAIAPWDEHVILSLDGVLGDDLLLQTITIHDDLPPGAGILRSAEVTLPIAPGAAGGLYLGVDVDPDGVLPDEVVGNNAALSETPTEVPAVLTLTLPAATLAENAGVPMTATVTRSGETAAPLDVTLVADDPTEVIVPAVISIPADAASADFTIDPIEDGRVDGDRPVTLIASAAGYSDGSASLTVTDSARVIGAFPDLVVSQVDVPLTADTEQSIQLGYRMLNQGTARAVSDNADPASGFAGSWQTRVWLSPDAALGNDSLLGSAEYVGTLAAGQQLDRSLSVAMPQQPGSWWIIVAIDSANTVFEAEEGNNVAVSAMPIDVQAAYGASVSAEIDAAPSGTPIPLSGEAFWSGSGAPAADVAVDVHIEVRDILRVLSATTDDLGRFDLIFDPLPGEAGAYRVGAVHPGLDTAPVQDSFLLYGLRVTPVSQSLRVIAGNTVTASLGLANLGELPLTGLQANVLDAPANLNVTTHLDTDALGPFAEGGLQIDIEALDAAVTEATVHVEIASAEEALVVAELDVAVVPPESSIWIDRDRLDASMLVGGQRTLTLPIANIGGAPSGPILTTLPDVSWMTLATPNPLPSLGPGETGELVIVLTPPADLPLGPYTGSLVIAGADNSIELPFELRATDDATGDLAVTVVDEYFYFAEGAPKLAGAEVLLKDYFTGDLIVEGTTGADGLVSFADLAHAWYLLEVSAEDHTDFGRALLVTPGDVLEQRVFLSRQTVRYIWDVQEIELEDRYQLRVTPIFEADVPAPVIVVEPAFLDLAGLEPGGSKQIDLTIHNYGLIAALRASISLPVIPDYRLSTPSESLGDVPAGRSLTVPISVAREGASSPAIARASNDRQDADADCPDPEWVATVTTLTICGMDVEIEGLEKIPVVDSDRPECTPKPGGRRKSIRPLPGKAPPINDPEPLPYPNARVDVPDVLQDTVCYECIMRLVYDIFFECIFTLSPASSCAAGAVSCTSSIPRDALELLTCINTYQRCTGKAHVPGTGHFVCGRKIIQDYQEYCFSVEGARASRAMASRDSIPVLPGLYDAATWATAESDFLTLLLGHSAWLDVDALQGLGGYLLAFAETTALDSDAGPTISESEVSVLLSKVPDGITVDTIDRSVERWNRTVAYWDAGIFEIVDVPAGRNTDFIDLASLDQAMQQMADAQAAAEQAGYISPADALLAETTQVAETDFGSEGICAQVRVQLSQDLVLTRQGFEARLDLANGTDEPLTDLEVTLQVVDALGQPASDRFGITEPLLANLDAIDGTGMLAAGTTGTVEWTLAPNDAAAAGGATTYYVSGSLSWTEGGFDVTTDLLPVPIEVQPNAAIEVDYFHQRDVYADDPFTPEVEPSIPYALGVIVRNTGAGTAGAVRIESGQPEIIDNDKGLAIDFDLIATRLDGAPLSRSLALDFGDLGPSDVRLGQWLLQSSLQGHFIAYEAAFTHIDPLGILSPLVREVRIHEMLRPVQALGALDDGVPDFLVNDEPDPDDLPDTLHLSDGSVGPVAVLSGGATFDGVPDLDDAEIELGLPGATGHRYVRLADPADGAYRLVGVVRSDGQALPIGTNAWQTDRTFPGVQQAPVREQLIHLFDTDSTGSYTLIYDVVPECTDADTDCDGLSDAWEYHWFGHLDRDGTGDADGDGATDEQEYLAGTDPTLAGPGVRIRLRPGLNLLAFPAIPAPEHASCATLLTTLGEGNGAASLARATAAGDRLERCTGIDGTDFLLNAGEGYAAELGAAHELIVDASPSDQCGPATLVPGLNLVGHPHPQPGLTCRSWLAANDPDIVRSIGRFDPVTGRYGTCAWSDDPAVPEPVGMDYLILPGEGYRVFASDDGLLERPDCQ